jgi:tRNA-2-methylthio-N6-dimethylallyladenosine synthase
VDLDERRANERWEVASCDRRSPYVTYVPIIEGCNKFCSYCIVPFSRGREKSRPAREILEELSALKRAGYSEVHLIGQNVNSYRPKVEDGLEGVRGATAFSRLLRAAAATTGLPRIKFTTSFPRDFHEDIVRALEEHENLCNWVHLPVQSGSDRVLRLMRRGYKVADYMQRVEWIKGARRNLSLTSDVIVGFPGETAEEFDMTMDLVDQCQYDGLYIFKYSKRSGTPAAKIPSEVSKTEMTGRFLRLEALQRTVQRKIYELYRGAVVSVLVEGLSAKSSSDWSGHTTCHKVVNFPSSGSDLAGKIVQVRVTAAKKNSLYGEQIIDWD